MTSKLDAELGHNYILRLDYRDAPLINIMLSVLGIKKIQKIREYIIILYHKRKFENLKNDYL